MRLMPPMTERRWRTASTTLPVPASPFERIIAAPSLMRRSASPRLVAPHTNGTVNFHLSMWCASSAGVRTSDSSTKSTPSASSTCASTKWPMRALAITGIETASLMPSIIVGSLMRATPPSRRMSAGTRSSAITAAAPASSAIFACSGVTTSMITPPLSISARPALTLKVPVSMCPLRIELPGARLRAALLEQPDVEEPVELLAANALRDLDEVLRRHVRELVLGVPGTHDLQEGRLAELLAKRLERHGAAVVDWRVEQLGSVRKPVRRREPEILARGGVLGDGVELVEALLGGLPAPALEPDPLGPGREALVQPHVGPALEHDGVAEPLVGDLVDDRVLGRDMPVVGLRLGLERVEDVVGPVDDAPDAVVRVWAVQLGEEVDRRLVEREPLERELGVGLLLAEPARLRVDRVVLGQPVDRPDAQLEHTVRGGGQVRHHRAALAPAPRG